ncbi:RHS repeat domain-containing protein [Sorangium sp. So ce1000]|uniref:RHS repeat domain-containing protein n=1 Tax=Sorangium sp. So ce1000 TaxID=3133325 RepID=UPI003F5FC437
MLEEGGYVQLSGDADAWMSSGRAVPSAAHFYLPTTFVDPFGNASQVVYDPYRLLVTEVTDPLSNVVEAVPDYRVLAPRQLTDTIGNVSAVRFDALGRVTAMAAMGKPGGGEGDALDDPTATFAYDLERFRLTGKPSVVHARAREQHGAGNPRWLDTYSYSDGSGNEVLRKVRAEPGLAPARDSSGALVHDAEGKLVFAHATSRWAGTGRVVLDNKGNPVKQYEPFFSATHEYEDEAELVEWGVTPILRYDPLGRLIRTDLPNGTFFRVTFDAWQQTSHDPNDTVLESTWYAVRQALPPGDPERRAADLASAHTGTPAVSHLDALGRAFRTVANNGPEGQYVTQTTLDIEGQPLLVTDARGKPAMRHRFGVGGQLLYQKSQDSGERWMLADATGQRLRAWNGRGFSYRWSYDVLRRITLEHVQPLSASERLARRYVYGEAHPQATALNLRRQAHQMYDGAGVVTSQAYDFKGNLLQASRRLRSDAHGDADWSVLSALTDVAAIAAAAEPLLEAESFGTQTAYDALNRPTSLTAPDGLTASDASEIKPTYNEASLLERIQVRVRGAAAWTTFVDNIDYDAKGQRERIDYGNGTSTVYTYDPLTFRLARLRTTRSSDGAVLQNLTYTYDPVGNIVEINDSAQQTVFFNNAVVSPNAQYIYDAVYRLIEATGREHAGGLAGVQRDQNDLPIQALPHANDAQALRNYTEKYFYDAVGNIQRMEHLAGAGTWIRRYSYEMTSNRLKSTFGAPEDEPSSPMYVHDAHGNMTAMPHIAALRWDENDQLRSADLDGGGVVYYTYDAAGQRVRKVWEHNGLVEERIYIGGYEVYRKRNATGLVIERQTLHVMDGARRIAMVETKTVDTSGPFTVTPRVRYQLDNHLGSASLEVDGAGLMISYEEYHPFGTTAYWSASSAAEVSLKRYRYTGKEKDEETGLYYHGARYYAPWLGRWTSADPAGMVDGPNLYKHVRGNPIRLLDPNGTDSKNVDDFKAGLRLQLKPVSADDDAVKPVQHRTRSVFGDRKDIKQIGELQFAPPLETSTSSPGATHSTPPGRGKGPAGATYVPPGRTSGSPTDGMSPETAAVYRYLTEENPLLGTVVGAIQTLGAVLMLRAEARAARTVARTNFPLIRGGAGPGRDAPATGSVTGKLTAQGSGDVPFDKEKLARIEANLSKEGVYFLYSEELLAANNARGMYIPGPGGKPGTVVLPPNPARTTVIEELTHLGQHRKTGWSPDFLPNYEAVRQNEMATQLRLLNLRTIQWTQAEWKHYLDAWNHWRTH